jgi:hypothetical protein
MQSVVRDLIGVRGSRASRLVPDSSTEVRQYGSGVTDGDLKDHPPRPRPVGKVDLEATWQARSRGVPVLAGAQPIERHAITRELAACLRDHGPSCGTQPTDVLLECTLVKADTCAPASRRHAASSLVVSCERSELLVKLLDLSGRRGPRTGPSMDVADIRARSHELKSTEKIRDRQIDDRLGDPQPLRDFPRSKPVEHQRQYGTLSRGEVTELLCLGGKTRKIDRHSNTVARVEYSVHDHPLDGPAPGSHVKA